MSQRKIEITFGADGTAEVKAVGYSGSACQEATKAIEQALGTVTNDTRTPEFYGTISAGAATVKAGNGR